MNKAFPLPVMEFPLLEEVPTASDLDNSTSNVLIPLNRWTSGLLVYKLPLSVEYGVSTSVGYGVSSSLSNTAYSSQQINMACPLPLDTVYRSLENELKYIIFVPIFYLSLEQILLIVYSLFQPDFNLLSDQEYSEEEDAKAMVETMEQYMSKTRTDYGLGVASLKIDNKDQFELKGQFLKEL
nr:hypothetical protein [Tanacetum cinerariifolium]